MSAHDSASLRKASEAGSITVSEKRDPEKAPVRDDDGSEDSTEARANVGLHEFALAKQSGLRVTREENRRCALCSPLFLSLASCSCLLCRCGRGGVR